MFSRNEVIIDDRKLVYWEANPQLTKTVVLVHGFKGEHSGLEAVAASFDDFRIILPDLPGFGESEPLAVSHSIENYALVLERVVTVLGLQSFVMVGHSYGGTVALVCAALFGSRLTALELAMPALPTNVVSRKLSQLEVQIGVWLPQSWQSGWFYAPIKDAIGYLTMTRLTSLGQRLLQFRSKLNWANQTDPRVVRECLQSFCEINSSMYATRIRVPTVIVGGERDFIASTGSLQELNRQIRGSRFYLLPQAGHVANLDRPALLGSLLRQFAALPYSHTSAVPLTMKLNGVKSIAE
jgi:pimeloyl-ACP methyl ester carboxylesterase